VHGTFRGFVHALLKLLAAPNDPVALQSLVTSPFFAYVREDVDGVDERNTDARRLQEAMRKYAREHATLMRSQPLAEWLPFIIRRCVSPACAAYQSDTGDDSPYSFLTTLRERWAVYAELAAATGADISIASFVKKSGLFRLQPAPPAPCKYEVGFYSSREVKSASFPVVIVIGCSEMLFPSALQRDTILPAGDLQALLDEAFPGEGMSVYGARTPEQHLKEQHQLLYHSLTRASERLVVLSPRKFAGQTHPAPSAALKPAVDGLGRGPGLSHYGVSRNRGMPAPSATTGGPAPSASPIPPAIRFASSWATLPAVTVRDAGKKGLSKVAADRLADLSPMGDLWRQPLAAGAPFAVARFPISKTSLESYVKCQRRFFYTKVLRVREEESGALTVGKLFHEVLARLAEPFGTRLEFHVAATDERLREIIDEQIEKDRNIPRQSLIGEALCFYLYVMIKSVLRLDAETSDDYEIAGIETPLDFEYGGFEFTGRADIVQKAATSGYTLVDYKSGNFNKTAKNLRDRTIDALERPERANWQVPIYVWGHGQTSDELPGAFKHLVQTPGRDPFAVTLYVCESEAEVPPSATSRKRDYQGYSYLLRGEVEAIMERAAAYAGEIFEVRNGFDKTDNVVECRSCTFNRLCDRSSE
jgi:ATP-dependent exoDNAse (exonuclease V) beta subunit